MGMGGGALSFLELVKEYRTLLKLSGGDAASIELQRALAEKVVEDAQRRAGGSSDARNRADLVGALLDAG